MRVIACVLVESLVAIVSVWAVAPAAVTRPEPDFILYMERCTTALAPLRNSDYTVKTVEGTPVHSSCERNGTKVTCLLIEGTGREVTQQGLVEYVVLLDSPPMLHLSDPQRADYIAIDSAAHTAVVVSRVVQERFLGSKVCAGRFVTGLEAKELLKPK